MANQWEMVYLQVRMINNGEITAKKEAGAEMGKRDMDIGNCARPIVMALSLNRDKKTERIIVGRMDA